MHSENLTLTRNGGPSEWRAVTDRSRFALMMAPNQKLVPSPRVSLWMDAAGSNLSDTIVRLSCANMSNRYDSVTAQDGMVYG